MTREDQNKILDVKIESNVNQYKVDRLNVEISAFSSGDLNNVIIPARPPRPNDNGNYDNGNDDNGNDVNGNDDNGDDKTSFIDLSWINDLQLYKKIASEVFSRYNGDKDSFELFTIRTFINDINNERVKNKKDAREEFKTVKKNIKSEALKQIVKELEQAIFGYDDDKDKEELEQELEQAEVLDKKFKNLISKKSLEPFKEYSKKAETSILKLE